MITLNTEEIMKILPHRAPMLFVDKIIECDDKKRIVGIKNVTIDEPFFQGHFPGVPIMPGVIQLEVMAQTGGVLLNRIRGSAGVVPYFMSMDKVKFRKIVKPGDQMRIEIELTNIRPNAAKFKGKILVEGTVVSEAELMCMVTEKKADT